MANHLVLLSILRRGKWIIVLTTLTLWSVANLYLRYVTPEFESRAILRIDVTDAINGGASPSSLSTASPEMARERSSAEMEVLKSPEILGQVVDIMGLQLVSYRRGRLKNTEIAKPPFSFEIDSSRFIAYGQNINIRFSGDGAAFQVFFGENETSVVSGQLGTWTNYEGNVFKLDTGAYANFQRQNMEFVIRYDDRRSAIDNLSGRISIVNYRGYSMFQLSYRDNIAPRAAAILNSTMEVYLQKELVFQQKTFDQTISYINGLIVQVNNDLDESERALSNFEVNRQASSSAALKGVDEMLFTQNLTELQKKRDQILLLNSIRQIVLSSLNEPTIDNGQPLILPTSPGIEETGISTIVQQINGLLSQRYFLLKRNTPNNPLIKGNSEAISLLKYQLINSIDLNIGKTKNEIKNMDLRSNVAASNLNTYPRIERDLQTVSRPFRINEEMYNILLNKRYETEIAKAAIVSRSTIVVPALVPGTPLSPQTQFFNFGSIAAGLILSLGYVLAREFLRTTIVSRHEVESNSQVPVIAEIVRSNGRMRNFELEVLTESKSAIAESFRALRANLSFVASGLPTNTRTIAISSTVSGEGKSYISTNLCATLTLLKQRVILLDLDLRKPKLHNTLNVPNDIGASSVLSGQVPLDRAIQKTSYQYFDILTAGPTPPNSAELLSSKQFIEMLEQLKESYDYIIMDTSPIGLVTDATPVLKGSDVVLYVVRSNFSRISFLSNLNRLRNDQGIDNMFLVLNYVDRTEQVYGYGYGYGYGNSGYYVDNRPQNLLDRVRKFLN